MEVAPFLRGRHEQERGDLGRDDRPDRRGRLAGARVAPDAAVEAERDERRVAGGQDRGERVEEEPLLVRGADAAGPEKVGRAPRSAHERSVDGDLDEAAQPGGERRLA